MAQNRLERRNASTLAELLPIYLAEVGWSERQLAQRADIPRGTIRNWCKGAVARPRNWRALIQVAAAMRLDGKQTDQLLEVAGHAPVSELWLQVRSEDDKLLLSKLFPAKTVQHRAPTFQAMPDLPYFVGRNEELAALKSHLLKDHHPTIYVLNGMAGVGKTTLATRLAYEVRDFFSDGVLWARADTSDVMSLLKLLADAFDQDVNQYTDIHSRSQAVRGILADKKAFLVLDNVDSSQQIQPLIPPTGPCAVLITTRQTSLSIARGCPQIHLKPFDEKFEDSQELFTKILGQNAVKSEETAYGKIANLLGHLPLALSIVAGRIAQEPYTTANGYLTELKREKAALDALAHEEQSVQASINSSYYALTEVEQVFFASLGVFGGEDFSLESISAITGQPEKESRAHLNRLFSLSLVQAGKNQRYRLHPLLREYAKTKIKNDLIYRQMIHYFAGYVHEHQDNFRAIEHEIDNIMAALNEAFERKMNSIAVKFTIDLSQFFVVSGLRDLANHRLEQAEHAAIEEGDIRSLALIKCARGNAEKNVHWQQALAFLEEGVVLAKSSQDEEVMALAYKDIGLFHHSRADFERANKHWQKSLILARKLEHHRLLGLLFNYLAAISINYTNNYKQAEELFLEGLALQRKQKSLPAMCMQLVNLSMIAYSLGNYKQAEAYIDESEKIAKQIGYPLAQIILSRHKSSLLIAQMGDYRQAELILLYAESLARELKDAAAIAFVASGLGSIYAQTEKYSQAVTYLQEGLLLANETRRNDIEIEVLTCLGNIAGKHYRHNLAESHFSKAISMARSYKDTWYLGRALEDLGEYYLARQKRQPARQAYDELLALSQQSEFLELLAAANFGLAKVFSAQGNLPKAREMAKKSRSIFKQIGHHKKEIVDAWVEEHNHDLGN